MNQILAKTKSIKIPSWGQIRQCLLKQTFRFGLLQPVRYARLKISLLGVRKVPNWREFFRLPLFSFPILICLFYFFDGKLATSCLILSDKKFQVFYCFFNQLYTFRELFRSFEVFFGGVRHSRSEISNSSRFPDRV